MTDKIIHEEEFIAKPSEDGEYEYLWLNDGDNDLGLSVVDCNIPYDTYSDVLNKDKTYKVKIIIEELKS